MNNIVLFLKEIHRLAQKLSWIENDSVVDELKDLFIRNSYLLNDDENTTSFIDALIYCSEKNVTPDDVANLISHLNAFFAYYFSTLPCHIVFIGRDWNSYQRNALFLPANMEKITVLEINLDTEPESIRVNLDDNTTIPIVVTDAPGFNFIKINNIEFPAALTALQFPERNTSRFDMYVGFIPLLNSRYEKLMSRPEVKSVILGSSYAYQGFPDKLLEKAINLSVYSGDLTLSYSLIKHITEKTNTKNFIVCVGLYDAFYELSLGAAPAFPVIRYFCKKHNIEYNFRSKAGKLTNESTKQYILGPLDLFVQHIYEKNHPQYFNDEELSNINSMLQDEAAVKKSVDFINNRSYSTDFTYSSASILSRVSDLSRHYPRKHSFENNKEVVASLISLIKETNSTLNFIVMPCPEFYIKNFDKNLKDETLAYIKSMTNDHNVFMADLSSHSAFTPDDFYDTDHLNFNGAKKLCDLVTQLGLDI
jgi:hypothetical protein